MQYGRDLIGARGQVDQTEKYMQDGLALLVQADDEYESARTLLALTNVFLVQRKYGEGINLLDQCRSTFERLQASQRSCYGSHSSNGFFECN